MDCGSYEGFRKSVVPYWEYSKSLYGDPVIGHPCVIPAAAGPWILIIVTQHSEGPEIP